MAAVEVQPILETPLAVQPVSEQPVSEEPALELSPILSTDAISQDVSRDSEDQSPSTHRTSSTPNSEISTAEASPLPKEEYFASPVDLKAKARARAEDLSLKEQVGLCTE
jgi:hypothetical protein